MPKHVALGDVRRYAVRQSRERLPSGGSSIAVRPTLARCRIAAYLLRNRCRIAANNARDPPSRLPSWC